jgi:hypothetical protein
MQRTKALNLFRQPFSLLEALQCFFCTGMTNAIDTDDAERWTEIANNIGVHTMYNAFSALA